MNIFGHKGPACNETIFIASDHAGFEMKKALVAFLKHDMGCKVKDCGAHELTIDDDYPVFVAAAVAKVSEDPENRRGIIVGGSGQGEAIVANRFKRVRAVVYYGEPVKKQTDAKGVELGLIESTRIHNNANVLSLGARFLDIEHAKDVIRVWLSTPFPGEPRHQRRIEQIDSHETT